MKKLAVLFVAVATSAAVIAIYQSVASAGICIGCR